MIEVRKTEIFSEWIDSLRDTRTRARIQARIERLAAGNPGDVEPVGEGVSELRIHLGSGYRVYFKQRGGGRAGHPPRGRRQEHASQGHQDSLALGQGSFGAVDVTKVATSRYDVAEHLRTPEEMAAYLQACLEEADGDAAFVAKALGDIARAKGMAQVARDAGLSRESLYKALSGERSPGFDTILKVIGALGLTLHADVNRA